MSEIEEILREAATDIGIDISSIELMAAADEIERLRAENEKLREALIALYKPVFENPVEVGSTLDLALRAAAAALGETDE